MKKLLVFFVGFTLTSQAVFAEEIASPIVADVTISEAAPISTKLPAEPELKYLDSEPMSLEPTLAQPNTAINSQTEPNLGGLLIPEMTAPVIEPTVAEMEIPQAPDASDIKEISPILENGIQANMGE